MSQEEELNPQLSDWNVPGWIAPGQPIDILESADIVLLSLDQEGYIRFIKHQPEEPDSTIAKDRSRWALVGQSIWEAFPALTGTKFQAEAENALAFRSYARIEVLSPIWRRWLSITFLPHGHNGLIIQIARKYPEERMMRLYDLIAALSRTLTIEQICAITLEKCLAALGGQAGWIGLLDDERALIKRQGEGAAAPGASPAPEHLALGFSAPITDCVRLRQMVHIEGLADFQADYPHLVLRPPTPKGYSVVCIPLAMGTEIHGAIEIDLLQDHAVSPSDRAFVSALAQQGAQALDRARHYEAEIQARQAAEEANALKDRFLAMVSHELRTPLASILGFASTLLTSDISWDAESEREFIEIIHAESLALKDLIENLLDVSRLQAKSLSIRPEPQALSAIVDGLRPRLDTLASVHYLIVNVPDDLPAFMGEGSRIAQVIANLVDNAVKYSPPGTSITISAEAADNMLQVSVSDEGQGIPREARRTVFEAFRQFPTDGPRGKGAGLGLAICKGLVEAHGGRIWIEDREGPGAAISFTVPIAGSRQQDISVTVPPSTPQ